MSSWGMSVNLCFMHKVKCPDLVLQGKDLLLVPHRGRVMNQTRNLVFCLDRRAPWFFDKELIIAAG